MPTNRIFIFQNSFAEKRDLRYCNSTPCAPLFFTDSFFLIDSMLDILSVALVSDECLIQNLENAFYQNKFFPFFNHVTLCRHHKNILFQNIPLLFSKKG